MTKATFNKDFKSELPDGSDGWLISKGTKVNVIEVDQYGVFCDYIDYTFYCDIDYLHELN